MKVCVTGGTGLVGAHSIKALLDAGHEVHALVRDGAKLAQVLAPLGVDAKACVVYEGDLNDDTSLKTALASSEAVLHAAGVFSNRKEDQALMERTNVEGTRRVIEQATALGLDPIVHVSSILALFPPPGKRQTADDPVRRPKSVYAATKAAAETIARGFQSRGAPVVCVYPGAVQGPHDPTFSDGPKMIARYLKSGSVLVTKGGLVYTDVRDLALLISRLMEPGRGPRRYMFGGHYLPHNDLKSLLASLTGRDLKAQTMPAWLLKLVGRAGDGIALLTGRRSPLTHEAAAVLTMSVPCDDSAALGEFRFEPVSAEQSFRDLIRWMYQAGRLDAAQAGALSGQAD